MSTKYSRESGSRFPDSLLDMPDFKDIDDSVKTIMMEYYTFMMNGNINSAIALKNAHPELEPYWVNAAKLNLMKEEIQNIGLFALMLKTSVISDTEPTINYNEGTLWYKPIYDK